MDIYVISAFDFVNSNSAGAKRIRNISSIFEGTIVNYPYTGSKNIFSIIAYFKEIRNFATSSTPCIFYFYPTVDPFFEILWVIFVIKYKIKVFYDLNEKRTIISRLNLIDIKSIKSFISTIIKFPFFVLLESAYSINSKLIVISSSLELKFKKKATCIYIPALVKIPSNLDYPPTKTFQARLGYFGTITLYKEDFSALFQALSILNSKNIRYTINIYGTTVRDQIEFENLKGLYGIQEQIKIFPFIDDQDELRRAMENVDLLVLIRRNNIQTKYGFSSKLVEYFLSGNPVITTDVSDNSQFIKNEVNGFIVSENNAEELAELLLRIYNGNYNLKAIGHAAINTAKEVFDRNRYSKVLNS
jgi:glycosyltransferase involved in cell wall biosynthesis